MKVQTVETATEHILNQKDSKIGSAKMFLINVDINKNNNTLKEPSDILGNVVGENLPDNLYQTVTDAINQENAININREELKALTSFQETVFIEDADLNIQETLITSVNTSDYPKTAIALIKDDEAVAYANYQDVYSKVNQNSNTSSKKEELLALKSMIQEVAREVTQNEEVKEVENEHYHGGRK